MFVRFHVLIAPKTFQRIDFALNNLIRLVAHADVIFMNQIITDYYNAYMRIYEKVLDRITILINEISLHLHLHTSVNGSATAGHDTSSVRASMILLTDSISYLLSLDPTMFKNAPSRFVNDKLRWNICQDLLRDMNNSLSQVMLMQSVVWPNATRPVEVSFRLSGLFRRSVFNKCTDEFYVTFNSLVHTFKKLQMEIVNSSTNFYDDYLEDENVDLSTLNVIKTWLSKQLMLYSENQTTQIKLAKEVTESKRPDINQILDRILSVVRRKVIKPLVSATDNVPKYLKMWYSKSLGAIQNLAAYYDSNDIEDKVRTLMIWRHPVARWATSDILQFKYTPSESWHSWEKSVSLQDVVQTGRAAAKIGTIMEDYSQVLKNELLRMEMEYKDAKDDVVHVLRNVKDYFSRIHSESLLDESFVLWVCLKPTKMFLSISKIDQAKAWWFIYKLIYKSTCHIKEREIAHPYLPIWYDRLYLILCIDHFSHIHSESLLDESFVLWVCLKSTEMFLYIK